MRPFISSFAALALVAALPVAHAAAQASRPSKKPDPAVADKVATLEAALEDRDQAHDADAIRVMGQLAKGFEHMNAADRKKVVRAVSAALTKGRLREPDKAAIYRASTAALGNMGRDGARVMERAFSRKRFPNKKDWTFMRADLVLNIGRTKDAGMVKFLTDRASRDDEDEVLAAAGETLGHYADANQKVRKQITKALVVKLGGLEAVASLPVMRTDTPQDLGSANAKQTLAVISDKWHATLGKLTDQSFDNGNDWQHWYNKNKSRNWDKDRKTK